MNQLQFDFKLLKKQFSELETFNNVNDADEYYRQREIFKNVLAGFLRCTWGDLNKVQILQLCAWVSTFRPVQPHTFLMYCGQQLELLTTKA